MRALIIAVLLLVPVQAVASGPEPVEQLKRWVWPHDYPPPMPGIGLESPGEARPQAPAKVPPKAAPPKKNEPAARKRPKKAKADDDDDDDPPPRRTRATVSPAVCAQIGQGIAAVGREGARREGLNRGYSSGQIAAAFAACGY